jgi:hypothetical protein
MTAASGDIVGPRGGVVLVSSTAYTWRAEANGLTLVFIAGSAITFTAPVGLPIGMTSKVIQLGAGTITFAAGSGVALNSATGMFTTSAQYAEVMLGSVGVDSYILSGEVSGSGGGGTPGGVAGDYQINDGAGGFGAASMNQPFDGQAHLIPSNSSDQALLILQNNALSGGVSASVTSSGSVGRIVLFDNAANSVTMDSANGIDSSTGIFDNGVRQFYGVFTVGTLSAGNLAGDTAAVSDATAPVLGAAPVGSGAVFCRVIWTGSIWVCG